MSTSLCVKAEVLGLLQRPAVLWSLVALVSVPEQQQPLWFQPWGGQHLPEVESVPGCLVRLRAGTGTSTSATEQLGGRGPQSVPSPTSL